jgi:D-amino peptidase
MMTAGDDHYEREMKDLSPTTETVVVKYGLGRYVARNLHPAKARKLIYTGTKKALERLKAGEIKPVKIPEPPIVLEMHFPDTGAADAASMMPGVERVDGLVTKFVTDDMREAYKAFYAQTRMQRSRLLP